MQECDNCGSESILEISAKCNDMCVLNFRGIEHEGYVPRDLPIGGGDYIEVDICLDCGKAQGIEEIEDPEFYTDEVGEIDEDDEEEDDWEDIDDNEVFYRPFYD